MALGLAVYLERKTLLWTSAWALAASALVIAKGWISGEWNIALPLSPVYARGVLHQTPSRALLRLPVSFLLLSGLPVWTIVVMALCCESCPVWPHRRP